MNGESAWVQGFFDCKFPLLKKDVNLSEAKKILEEHKPDKLYKYRKADDRGFALIETGSLWLAIAGPQKRDSMVRWNHDSKE